MQCKDLGVLWNEENRRRNADNELPQQPCFQKHLMSLVWIVDRDDNSTTNHPLKLKVKIDLTVKKLGRSAILQACKVVLEKTFPPSLH